MTEFTNFFKVGTKESMARLLAFICAVAAAITSVGAIWLGLTSTLTYEYVMLVIGLWAAAHGGKTWAKSVEIKGKENEAK